MSKKLFFFFFLISFLKAGSCYSILTETGLFTPVYPYNFRNGFNFQDTSCPLLDPRIVWDTNLSYVGCYKKQKDAEYALKHMKFNFKNPKIVKHKFSFKDQYVIFPKPSGMKEINIERLISKYEPEKLLKRFPKKFYGDGIDFVDINKITFMPTINLYDFYRYYKKHGLSTKIMILYNGVYSLEYLYKKIHNSEIIEKVSKNTYILKTPIYVSPTAKLVFNDKKVLLETTPRPMFFMYHGEIYAKNSEFIAWNLKTGSFDKREHIPEEELLLIGLQKPRPYFIGLSGSKTYFVSNLFMGLGFHSTSATFGISLLNFPKDLLINDLGLFTYLNSRGMPEGYYIGNTMKKNMMGFYCSEAKDTALIGNLMYDNLIYDIDPHDYSENLLIVRNMTAKAQHAHGIVISRQVDHTVIAQNFTFNNHSAGIMLDRLSDHNIIYDNLSVLNGYMGISIQESNDVLMLKNKLIGNNLDGIIVRNSLKNSIYDNYVAYNGKNGIEVLTKNINNMIYRDFTRDPYTKATSAVIKGNKIRKNILYGMTVKNNAAIKMSSNKIISKNNKNYGGDLNIFIPTIEKNGGDFKLYGIGNPYRPKSTDMIRMNKNALNEAVNIFIDSSKCNDFTFSQLSKIFLMKYGDKVRAEMEYIRGITNLNPNSMASFGYLKLMNSKNKKEFEEGLSYIAQSVIFGDETSKVDLMYMIYMFPISKKYIDLAFEKAVKRLEDFKLVEDPYNVACSIDDRKKLKIKSALSLFKYKYEKSGAKNYFEYCKDGFENFTIFTPNIIKKIFYIFDKANKPKKAYYKKLLKENEIIKSSEQCKLVAIRLKNINESQTQYYKANRKSIMKEVEPYIDRYLKMINRFRLQKINKEDVYKLMQE